MNNKAHLKPDDYDSNGDIVPMSWKEEKGDLISREALKEVIKANHYLLSAKNNSTDYGMFTTGIMQAIDNAPTISPEKALMNKLKEGAENDT